MARNLKHILSFSFFVALFAAFVFASPALASDFGEPDIDSGEGPKISIENATVSNIVNRYYMGYPRTQSPVVKFNGDTLKEGTDYKISYSNNTEAGIATVKITGKGFYTGTITRTFTIYKRDISKTTITLSSTSFKYNGSKCAPSVTVKLDGTKLTKGTSYTLSYSSGRTKPGTYKVTIKPTGSLYGSSITKTFKIVSSTIADATITKSATYLYYTGSKRTPSVSVKIGGVALTKGTDYTLSYSSGRINVGAYTITVKGKGYVSGSKKLTYYILPNKTSVTSLVSSKAGTFTIKWKKVTTQNSGYEIRYSTKSSMSNATVVSVAKTSTVSKTILKLKKQQTYYVQIRTYKNVGAKVYHSGWTTVKKITTL